MAFQGGRSSNGLMAQWMGMAILAIAIASTVYSEAAICPDPLVYPWRALCSEPALYNPSGGEEVYELGNLSGERRLAPEWDESNSTYYMRLAEVGAKYKFQWWPTRDMRYEVGQNQDVRIVNAETGRVLGWRKEGENEYFLVEGGRRGAGRFQFVQYTGPVPCILPLPPRSCSLYTINNFGTSDAVSPYVEDNITYFTLSAVSEAFPFAVFTATPARLVTALS